MKFFWVHVLAFLIAMSSLAAEAPIVEFEIDELSSVAQLPYWQTSALINSSKKHAEKNFPLAQDFIPILLIAETPDSNQGFVHYLPLYDLVRQKEYFLLI